jgi:hypothetical protein
MKAVLDGKRKKRRLFSRQSSDVNHPTLRQPCLAQTLEPYRPPRPQNRSLHASSIQSLTSTFTISSLPYTLCLFVHPGHHLLSLLTAALSEESSCPSRRYTGASAEKGLFYSTNRRLLPLACTLMSMLSFVKRPSPPLCSLCGLSPWKFFFSIFFPR